MINGSMMRTELAEQPEGRTAASSRDGGANDTLKPDYGELLALRMPPDGRAATG